MKISMKKSAAAILFAVAVMFSAAVAHATTVTEAQTLLANLKTETQSVVITGKSAEKDRTGLIGKIDNASFAVDSAKFCGAVQKLNDFKQKINQLIAAGSINQNPTDAAGNTLVTGTQLLADADAAINAINSLQTQSGGASCF